MQENHAVWPSRPVLLHTPPSAMFASYESEALAVTDTVRHAVTGNRLRDGVPIYFAGEGRWTTKIIEAVIADDGEALLAEAGKGPFPLEAVGSYVIDVTVTDGTVRPIGVKENIRAFGPTA